MNFSTVNWLAVIACVVASMIIGFIWFGFVMPSSLTNKLWLSRF